MRRPAQHHHTGPAAPAWAHPYTGLPGIAVFYNDGGQSGAPPAPVPSPADVARAGQAPPTPPAPVLPPAPHVADGRDVFVDKHTGQPMTQGRFTQLMTKQYDKSRHAAYREMAEALGLTYDPETFDADGFKATLKEGHSAREQMLTDDQRRSAELEAREQALAAREASARQADEAATARDRDSKIRAALVSRGATGDDLDDAAALIRVDADADDTAIAAAADTLKERRGVLFGTAPAPQTLPPAPSGGPAGGNAPRKPASDKDALKAAARKLAIDRGYRPKDPAA